MMKSLMPCWEYSLRMCHRMGRPPISTMGLGRTEVSSLSRVPRPPARMTAFILPPSKLRMVIDDDAATDLRASHLYLKYDMQASGRRCPRNASTLRVRRMQFAPQQHSI